MAECDPPKPPPLLREPERKFPTAADLNERDRHVREDQEGGFWSVGSPLDWGCLVLIAIPLLALGAFFGRISSDHSLVERLHGPRISAQVRR